MTQVFEALGFVRQNGGAGSLCDLWGIKPTAVFDQIAKRRLPWPISISPRLKGWPPHEIAAIRKLRIAGASEENIKALVEELEAARTAEPAVPA
jgi:prophage regulatory protein